MNIIFIGSILINIVKEMDICLLDPINFCKEIQTKSYHNLLFIKEVLETYKKNNEEIRKGSFLKKFKYVLTESFDLKTNNVYTILSYSSIPIITDMIKNIYSPHKESKITDDTYINSLVYLSYLPIYFLVNTSINIITKFFKRNNIINDISFRIEINEIILNNEIKKQESYDIYNYSSNNLNYRNNI